MLGQLSANMSQLPVLEGSYVCDNTSHAT